MSVGNVALVALRTKGSGPAPHNPDLQEDIIDEALYLFRTLIFFKHYEFKVGRFVGDGGGVGYGARSPFHPPLCRQHHRWYARQREQLRYVARSLLLLLLW